MAGSFHDGFYGPSPIVFYGATDDDTVKQISGSTAGTSGATASLSVTHPLASVTTGVSTAGADVLVSHPLAGISNGVSGVTATARVTWALAGVSAGVSGTAVALSVAHPLAGITAGSSGATANLSVSHPLAGLSAGVSTVAGATNIAHPLAGLTAGTGTAAGATNVTHPLAGVTGGVSNTVETLTYTALLGSGTSSGVSGASATLTATVALEGWSGPRIIDEGYGVTEYGTTQYGGDVSWETSTTVTGDLKTSIPLAGVISGVADASASVIVAHPLAAVSSGVSGATANLAIAHPLAGITAGTSSVAAATLLVAHPLAGVTAGTSTAVGNIRITHPLAGITTGTSDIVGDVRILHPLAGSSDGVSTVFADEFELREGLDVTPIPSEEAFGLATVLPGPVFVTPPGITSDEAFGIPTDIDFIIYPPSLDPDEVVETPKLSLKILPTGIPSDQAFGAPQLNLTITPAGITTGEAFGTAKSQLYITEAGGITTGEGFGGHQLFGGALGTESIPSAEAFGVAKLNFTIYPASVTSGEVVGTPLSGPFIRPIGIPSDEVFGTHIIGPRIQVVAPTGIASGQALGVPRTNLFVRPIGIPSGEGAGHPSVLVVHLNLLPSSIGSAEEFGTLSIVHLGYLFPGGIPSQEGVGTPGITIPLDWWSDRYPYRRRIVVAPATDVPIGHPVLLRLPAELIEQNKLQPDYADLELVKPTLTGWLRYPREIARVGEWLEVRFLLDEAVALGDTDDYYVYYGNVSATGEGRPTFVDNPWPVQVTGGSGRIDFTRPEEHWRNGVSTVLGAKAALEFVGTSVRVVADRSPMNAIVEIQVDDGEWEAVDLFAPFAEPAVEVYRREELSPSIHRVRMRATGRSSPSSRGKSVNVVRFDYVAPVTALDMGEEVDERFWEALTVVGEE